MTGKLTGKQLTWLRGLKSAGGRWVLMSATEMGDPEVSTLQSLGLVRIMDLLDGKNWQLMERGEAAIGQQTRDR